MYSYASCKTEIIIKIYHDEKQKKKKKITVKKGTFLLLNVYRKIRGIIFI
jgi:hypothetical protein